MPLVFVGSKERGIERKREREIETVFCDVRKQYVQVLSSASTSTGNARATNQHKPPTQKISHANVRKAKQNAHRDTHTIAGFHHVLGNWQRDGEQKATASELASIQTKDVPSGIPMNAPQYSQPPSYVYSQHGSQMMPPPQVPVPISWTYPVQPVATNVQMVMPTQPMDPYSMGMYPFMNMAPQGSPPPMVASLAPQSVVTSLLGTTNPMTSTPIYSNSVPPMQSQQAVAH